MNVFDMKDSPTKKFLLDTLAEIKLQPAPPNVLKVTHEAEVAVSFAYTMAEEYRAKAKAVYQEFFNEAVQKIENQAVEQVPNLVCDLDLVGDVAQRTSHYMDDVMTHGYGVLQPHPGGQNNDLPLKVMVVAVHLKVIRIRIGQARYESPVLVWVVRTRELHRDPQLGGYTLHRVHQTSYELPH